MRKLFDLMKAGTQFWLTMFVTTVYNLMLAWGVIEGKLSFENYIFAVGPINTMVMGFWMGGAKAAQDAQVRVLEERR